MISILFSVTDGKEYCQLNSCDINCPSSAKIPLDKYNCINHMFNYYKEIIANQND